MCGRITATFEFSDIRIRWNLDRGVVGPIRQDSVLAGLALQDLNELFELVAFDVRNDPKSHSRFRPVEKIIPLARRADDIDLRLGGGPDKNVDEVFVPLINECRHRPVV
jgi:hypothetical protein